MAQTITGVENIVASHLFRSGFYEVKNWGFNLLQTAQHGNGYNDCFCMVLVKNGRFLFDLGGQGYDMHTGHIVIEKPGYEYRLRPASGECTIINFTKDFYTQLINDCNLQHSFFFSNSNILSVLLKANAAMEYVFYRVLQAVQHCAKLEMDLLVLELLKLVISAITNDAFTNEPDAAQKANHLVTIERAKEYMNGHFEKDLSLEDISKYSWASLFHFSRLFKKFTALSPYQYLLQVRLKHSELLLRNSNMPVADISVLSGFNSAENFASAFKQQYKMSPTQFRK